MCETMRDGYTLSPTPEDWDFAKTELGEDPEKKESQIKALRLALKELKHVNICDDDDFLLKFLRSTRFSQRLAVEMIEGFARNLTTLPNRKVCYNEPCLSPCAQDMLNRGIVFALPVMSEYQPRSIVIRRGLMDPKTFDVYDILKAVIQNLEIVLLDPVTQIRGVQFIEDMRGLGLKHMPLLKPSIVRTVLSTMSDFMPYRNSAFHLFQPPFIIRGLISQCKLLLSSEFMGKIHSHKNEKSLHAMVDPNILPLELGGNAGEMQELADRWHQHVLNNLGYFHCYSSVRYDAEKL